MKRKFVFLPLFHAVFYSFMDFGGIHAFITYIPLQILEISFVFPVCKVNKIFYTLMEQSFNNANDLFQYSHYFTVRPWMN